MNTALRVAQTVAAVPAALLILAVGLLVAALTVPAKVFVSAYAACSEWLHNRRPDQPAPAFQHLPDVWPALAWASTEELGQIRHVPLRDLP